MTPVEIQEQYKVTSLFDCGINLVGKYIWIKDLGQVGFRSVTNDAENVVPYVLWLFNGNYPIIYRDSQGVWDQILHDGKKFTRFHSLGQAKNFEEVIKRLVVS
jgi:hypothetical protein